MQDALVLAAFSLDQAPQPLSRTMQSRAQRPALRTCGAVPFDQVLLQTAPDIIAPLRAQFHTDAIQGAVDHASGPATIEFAIWRRMNIGHVDVFAVFIAQ